MSIKDFELGKCRGDGKFGRVLMCRHRQTGTLYAIKEVPKAVIKKNALQKQLTWQIKIQTFLDHANIVKLYGCFSDALNVYLLMEYMQGGTLFDQLKMHKGGIGLPEQEVCKRMRQVCSAVYYMHDIQVAHRDIKPENIVLSNVPNNISQGIAKLCDFGWSTLINERRRTYCGTFDYSSPQMLEGKQYDESIDLWSLGVLAYQLLTGKLPFYSISRKQTINNITSVHNLMTQIDQKNVTFPTWMSWQACSFIQSLLKKEPGQRREAEMLLSHPFLTKYKDRVY